MDIQELFVKQVDASDPDLFSFRFDFVPEGKALASGEFAPVVTTLDDGDLLIDGWAAVFEGQDRQGENFTDGAFQNGIKSFINGQATLAYHHNTEWALGKVLELDEHEGKGLHMKARVDGAIQKHPQLATVYEQIKKGTLSALSIGGIFRRKLTAEGPKIHKCDFTEISVTPVPIHPGTKFAVVAGKALREMPTLPEGGDGAMREQDEEQLNWMIAELDATITRIEQSVAKRSAA